MSTSPLPQKQAALGRKNKPKRRATRTRRNSRHGRRAKPKGYELATMMPAVVSTSLNPAMMS